MSRTALLLACAWLASSVLRAQTAEPDDRFIAGYAAAVLEREFSLKATGLVVVAGEISYPDGAFGTLEREQIVKSLRAIPGVRSVSIVPWTPATGSSTNQQGGVPDRNDSLTAFLSPGRLFDPLLADPRWPHFFAAYNYYTEYTERGTSSKNIEHVGSAGFGETMAIYGMSHANGLRWQAGIQAGVFAIFDLDSESLDLINTDFFLGPYAALRYKDFSLLTRLLHQSSHLGDEYILREEITGGERVNLSYETVDALLSYELPYGFRAYGGGAYLLNTDPDGLEPWIGQYGAEWRAPFTLGADSSMRPIVAADFQQREENDWDVDYSLRAGVQFEDPGRFGPRLALMLELYNGSSPNGQFFTDRIEFVGIGLHFYF